jgi:gamma-glutamylcysteine synthetase
VFGSIPLFWWPIKAEVIKSIVLQDVLIFSIYNPAHLFEKLKAEGFEIVMESPQGIELRKSVDGSLVTFENFSYFMHLVQHSFIPEDTVLEIVRASERELTKIRQSGVKTARIELAFEQRLRK